MTDKAIPKAFEGASFDVTARSGRVFRLRELSGMDVVTAGSMVPEDARSETEIYLRVAFSLQSVDGKVFPPIAGRQSLQARLQMVSGSELDDLIRGYLTNTSGVKDLPKE